MIDLGSVAYAAYRVAVGGRSAITGELLPTWDGQDPEIRAAWRAAADGVRMYLEMKETT
jgi:hypothetical protein